MVLDLDNDGLETTALSRIMDINGDGELEETAWFGDKEGVLAFDANNNGRIENSGLELFGNNSDVDGDGQADGFANGFEALSALAEKHLGEDAVADGVLDSSEIKALENQAALRMIVGDELQTLTEAGVTSINLDFENSDRVDDYGNEFRQIGSFTREVDGNSFEAEVADVWLQNTPYVEEQPPVYQQPQYPGFPPMHYFMQQYFQMMFGWMQMMMQMFRGY